MRPRTPRKSSAAENYCILNISSEYLSVTPPKPLSVTSEIICSASRHTPVSIQGSHCFYSHERNSHCADCSRKAIIMAPALIQPVGGSAAKDFKKESTAARLLGSGMDLLFHVASTIAKVPRLCWNCGARHLPSCKATDWHSRGTKLNTQRSTRLRNV